MISISVTIPTIPAPKLAKLTRGGKERLAVGINRACLRLERRVKLNLSLGGTAPRSRMVSGRVRIIERNPTKHLRIISDALRSSWKAVLAVITGDNVIGRVATTSKYAAIHEFGGMIVHYARSFLRGIRGRNAGRIRRGATSSGWSVRIPERPYARPALNQEREAMAKDVTGAWTAPVR